MVKEQAQRGGQVFFFFSLKKTQNPELHGELGLNLPSSDSSPSTSISLIENENNILATLLVGKDSKSGKDTRYVRRPDDQQVWLAWRNFELPNTKIGWLDEDLFSIKRWRVADITISHTNASEVFIARENYAEQYFKIQNLDEGVLPLNPYVGNQIGSSIEKLPIKNIMLNNTNNHEKYKNIPQSEILQINKILQIKLITIKDN